MIIYKISNKINNRIYIGQTIRTIAQRWSAHCSKRKNSLIHRAILKYGKENFTIEEIDGANSVSELNYLEQHHIHMYNSIFPNGYNLLPGGRSSSHTEHTKAKIKYKRQFQKMKPCTPEQKLFISKLHKGRKHSEEMKTKLRIRIISEETRRKISLANSGKPGSMKGKKHSDSSKLLMSNNRKGFDSPARQRARKEVHDKQKIKIKATNISTGEVLIFSSITDAAKVLKIDGSNISRACVGYFNGRSVSKGWKFEKI